MINTLMIGDPFWYDKINVLLLHPLEFWPCPQMTYYEKMNSLTRFTLYAGILLAFVKNNSTFLMLSLLLIALLVPLVQAKKFSNELKTKASHTNPLKYKSVEQPCTLPTKDNPFGNVLVSDYSENPERNPACESSSVDNQVNSQFFDEFEQDPYDIYNKKHSQRQFYSMPNTRIPNDQSSFAKWLYGDCKKTCKEKPNNCNGTEAFG